MKRSRVNVPLSLYDTARYPAPGMEVPTAFAFNPDGTQLTYLHADGDDASQKLHMIDTESGAICVLVAPQDCNARSDDLPIDEQLRRERARILANGLTQYSRADQSEQIMVPFMGSIFVMDNVRAPLRKLVDGDSDTVALAPTLSPDGQWVAYVQGAEIHVISSAGGEPTQLTSGAAENGKTNGLAEFIAQEELDRTEGYWWSPDSRWIAYTEVDEQHIPLYRIPHYVNGVAQNVMEEYHYPFAGQANANVRLAVVARQGGIPHWMDMDFGEEVYLARAFWWQSDQLGAIVLNRAQTEVQLVKFDIETGSRITVLRETSSHWINLIKKPAVCLTSGGFIWASERSGFMHLYLYDAHSDLVRQITDGEWVVDEISGVNEDARLIYFISNREHATEAHLYEASLEGGQPRRLTSAPGWHTVTLDPTCRRFVDVHSAINSPSSVRIRATVDGAPLHSIYGCENPLALALVDRAPEMVSILAEDGTTLYAALYRPSPKQFGKGPYPTIIELYGGPRVQVVTNSWGPTADVMLQYLRAQGFLVFRLDNRGSARRGLAFEGALRHHMGSKEVEDQKAGVRWLVEQGLADQARVGVIGWSYGGYLALMCLIKAPELFRAAVARSPVTELEGYDTGYTERYMGTPESNPQGYVQSSIVQNARSIQGDLLLIHGLIDENVHFAHTARLANALILEQKQHELAVLPNERHMPRQEEARLYINEQIVTFFKSKLHIGQ